jgi:thioredoxin-dependent peroxiredoxin
MAAITFKGSPVQTAGTLPSEGSSAPGLSLTAGDLSEKTLADCAGKKKILNIAPSFDTSVCALTAKQFSGRVAGRDDVVLLDISADLPFAQARFCEAEKIENGMFLSSFRSSFGRDYGVEMIDGPLRGLLARAVLVLDENDEVLHAQLVPEIAQEPDYDAVLTALN